LGREPEAVGPLFGQKPTWSHHVEDKIVELLGAGTPAHVIAQVVGCDPSYISQLGSREDIVARVSEIRASRAAEMVQHDNNIGALEQVALERMGRLLPLQTNLMQVTKVFQVLNAAKKSSDMGIAGNAAQPGTIVTIHMPAAAQVHFKLTSDQQVIEIEGRSMVPLPSHMVAAKLRGMKADRLLEDAKILTSTPALSNRTKSIVDQL